MSQPHRMLMIATGGTIAGEVARDKRDDDMIRTAENFAEIVSRTKGYLDRKHGIKIELETREPFEAMDSSDIAPEQWTELAALVRDEYDNYDSFVLTHGTNTLGYTCAALTFSLANPAKPIILTGSQVAAGLPGSDGLMNLENAMRVAVWKGLRNPIKGVVAVFGSHIISGARVKKDTEFDYDAFKSFAMGSIGRIGRIIHIDETNLAKHVGYLSTPTYPEAWTNKELICDNRFDTRIASLTEFPGMSSKIFETLVEHNDIQGFILRAFGAGDAATKHKQAFQYLKGLEIPIVVTTQAPNGNSNFQVNEPGKRLRDGKLAIPAYDMSIECQTAKLAWLLAKKAKGRLSYEQLCTQMVHDMRGEINVMWEVGE